MGMRSMNTQWCCWNAACMLGDPIYTPKCLLHAMTTLYSVQLYLPDDLNLPECCQLLLHGLVHPVSKDMAKLEQSA